MKRKKTKTPKTPPPDSWVEQPPDLQTFILPILNTEQEAWIFKAERALANAGFIIEAENDDAAHRVWTLRVKN